MWGNLNYRAHVFNQSILVLSLGLFILFRTNVILHIAVQWQKLKTPVTKISQTL